MKYNLAVVAMLLLLSATVQPSHATERDFFFVVDNPAHQCDNKSWHDGLWQWQASSGKATLLLAGSNSCRQSAQTGEKNDISNLSTQLTTYALSSVAHSADGRFVAVSGLVRGHAFSLMDLRHGIADCQRQLDKTQMQTYGDHYRVLLLDLVERQVHNVFDTLASPFCSQSITVENDTPFGLQSEFNTNPTKSGDALIEDFMYGSDAKINLRFSDDSEKLYLRIYRDYSAHHEYRGTTYISTPGIKPANKGVHSSFVIDIVDPLHAATSLRRAVVPGEPYLSSQSLLKPLYDADRTEMFSLSNDGRVLARSLMQRQLQHESFWFTNEYKYTHTLSLIGNWEGACLDDVICSREMQQEHFIFSTDTAKITPEIRWADDDMRLLVRKDNFNFAIYDVQNIVDKDSARSGLDTTALQKDGSLLAESGHVSCDNGDLHPCFITDDDRQSATHDDVGYYKFSDVRLSGDLLVIESPIQLKRRFISDTKPLLEDRNKFYWLDIGDAQATMRNSGALNIGLRAAYSHVTADGSAGLIYYLQTYSTMKSDRANTELVRQQSTARVVTDTQRFGSFAVQQADGSRQFITGWRSTRSQDFWPLQGVVDYAF